jgi:hydrogenase-4 component B
VAVVPDNQNHATSCIALQQEPSAWTTATRAVSGSVTYRADVVDLIERYFYRPLIAAVRAASRMARRLQSGRLDAYMTYMLIAVLAVLAVVIATS